MDDSVQLQEAVEQTLQQKQLLEAQASEQAQLLNDLESQRQELDKNNRTLVSRVETLERRIANANNSAGGVDTTVVAKLEEELVDAKTKLEEAQEELARVAMAESSQRMCVALVLLYEARLLTDISRI